jgi:Melibiase
MMGHSLRSVGTFLVALAVGLAGVVPLARDAAPPNEPADVNVQEGRVTVRYDGRVILEGRLANPEALRLAAPSTSLAGDVVNQVVAFYGQPGTAPLRFSATVSASGEAFPAEADRPLRGLPIVRHSVGLSRSLRNDAVYDRLGDWVISVDDHPRTSVQVAPLHDAPGGRTFTLEARGAEIVLRFRPRFYQRHRGLRFFEPWTYRVWPDPIVGWCSWFAFSDQVTEADIERTADVVSEVLAPYGYEYLQIDDGYQRGTGLPDLWLNANEKFPSGLPALARYIRGKGLKPGIWTNAAFTQSEYANAHEDWFVRDPGGAVARGNWIGHPVDASVPEALDALVRPIYEALRTQGWEYFKLDALRHLRYEGYNAFRDHFLRNGTGSNPTDAFRRYVTSVRDEIGRDRFLLACWGVRPEIVGLVDGCRLGTDGFSYAGLAQYNSFNNVVWRNDPDHIELSDAEAWRSTMVTSLTGSLFMLTDKPERYRTPIVEPAKRAAPVLVTLPGQLYDVDPSRSAELARVDAEVSGRDPKPFDASLTPAADLYLLEVNRPFESWMVLGRTGGADTAIPFEELGLDPAKPHLVFEFWQRRYHGGDVKGSFRPGDLPRPFNSQVFVIRERQDHPQLIATGRHITGGGPDLLDVSWAPAGSGSPPGQASSTPEGSAGVLAGRSRVVGGDPYEVFLTEPAGWRFVSMACDGGRALPAEHGEAMVRTGCAWDASGEVAWRARFGR